MNRKAVGAIYLAAGIMFLAAAARAAGDVPVAQDVKAPKAVNTTVENTGDSAFASDLKAAEDLLKGLSHERKMTPKQSREYVAKEMARARKFYDFAKATAIPHSRSITQRMRTPDAMIKEGLALLQADPASWQGYDMVASGSLVKEDTDTAIKNYEKAVETAPELQKDWYRFMLASCHGSKSDTDKAIEMYKGIIERTDNWIAVKSAYISLSRTLLAKGDPAAAGYFDRGFALYTPGEQAALLKSGICAKFSALKEGPEACGNQAGK